MVCPAELQTSPSSHEVGDLSGKGSNESPTDVEGVDFVGGGLIFFTLEFGILVDEQRMP